MIRVRHAAPVSIPVPFEDEMGNAITPTAISWTLLDQDEVELSSGALDPNQPDPAVTIAGNHNTAVSDRQARILRVTFVTGQGTVTVDIYYIVTPQTVLGVLKGSFQTYAQALVLRESFGGLLDGWDVADQPGQVSALEHAFHKLARLTFRVVPEDTTRYASFEDEEGYGVAWLVTNIAEMPVDKFNTLDSRFRKALRRAQLIEADKLLGGDVITKRRMDGILSETVGESSMMFNSRPALDLPVSREAHREIGPYVYHRVALVRG